MRQSEHLPEDQERELALLTAVRGAVLSGGFSEQRVQILDLTVRGFSAEMTAESLANQLDRIAHDVGTLTGQADSSGDLSELDSLRLQMAMDRVSEMMSTLSNLLKKISDTAKGITKNLK